MNDKRIDETTITDIKITDRIRKDMGDLQELADSMAEGILHPIGITPKKVLVFGERRLRAARDILGWGKIPARIVDVQSVLHGQFAENLMRKQYTVSERVAIVEAMRSFNHGGDRRSKQVRKCDDENPTVDEAAKRAGLGGKDGYFRAKSVADKGVPELVEAMDEGRLSISKAAEIARLPEQDQRRSARLGRKVIDRDPHDFYPTPPEVTRALLTVEDFDGEISEPACGDGAVSNVLQDAGYDVLSSDLIDRGYGEVADFLMSRKVSDNIVTNPPFKLSEKFIKKALAYSRRKVAMFLPLVFLEGQDRNELLRRSPLKTVYVFTNRVTFYRTGTERRGHGRAAYAWYVWEHGYKGQPRIQWISTANAVTPVVKRQERQPTKPKLLPISTAKPVRVNNVVEGDCRELVPRLPDGSIHLCLTSPPYTEQRKGKYPGVPEHEYPRFTVDWMAKLWDKLTDDGSVLIVIDPHVKKGVMSDYIRRTEDALCDFGWKQHQTQIWHKRDRAPLGHKGWPRRCWENILWFSKTAKPFCDPWACGQPSDRLSIERIRNSRWSPGGKRKKSGVARVPDVWNVPVGGIEKGIDHPAMFPVELAEKLIKTFCPSGGTILDPFAGSGSSLIAAKKLGCDYYGFDLVADYCKTARRRLAATNRGGKARDAG